MKSLILTLPLLLAGGCQLTEGAAEQVRLLTLQAEEARKAAEEAETAEEKLLELQREQQIRTSIERVKAEDYGRQTGFAWELLAASLGLGGLGVARTFGKSRATQELAQMRAKLEAFEAGMKQVPPIEPPTS